MGYTRKIGKAFGNIPEKKNNIPMTSGGEGVIRIVSEKITIAEAEAN